MPPGAPNAGLSEEQRVYLWEVEHRGLVLAKVGFGPIAGALRRAEEPVLRAMLAADFEGRVPESSRVRPAGGGTIRVVRHQEGERPSKAMDGEAFLAKLLEYRKPFGSNRPQVKLSLMGLAPEFRERMEGPWVGTALLRMWGETAPGQPAEVALHVRYRLLRPDGDTYDAGGWLSRFEVLHGQMVMAAHPLFREVAAARGLAPEWYHDNWKVPGAKPLSNTGGAFLCDYNRDGCVDILITDTNGYTFFQGQPDGRFVDVTSAVGVPSTAPLSEMTHTVAAVADLDGDGWEDLIIGDQIYGNRDGRAFERIPSGRTNLRHLTSASGVIPGDYDRDGKIDLYVTRGGASTSASWLDGKSGSRNTNQLWHNEGNWQFRDVTQTSGTAGGSRSVFTALWLDADDDGWPDLYVPNEFGNGTLLVNRGNGTFRDVSLCEGPCDFGTMGATACDFDNDGRIDLYAANMYSKAGSRIIGNLWPGTYPDEVMAKMRRFVTGSQLHRNLGGLKFEQVGPKFGVASVGWAYGPAAADFDNDGWPDLVATAGYISQDRDKPDG
ncbi:MAG: VCBS repeat-containing protein [Isosphaeraceae bacterium]|nr:VCBS repeat-containing protein [Isosphaeraceae bacterium]